MEKIFSDDANNYMVERVQQYGKDKGVNVTCELVAVTDFVTKLNAAIEAGVGVPDVISADATRLVNYYPDIPCVDVSKLVDEINADRPYFKAAYDGTKIGDSHYFVPFCSSTTMMFVRKDKLEAAGIRCEVDDRSEKIGFKIRSAQMEKVPYMLVAGDKDVEAGTVSVRSRKDGDEGASSLEDFIARITEEIATKAK